MFFRTIWSLLLESEAMGQEGTFLSCSPRALVFWCLCGVVNAHHELPAEQCYAQPAHPPLVTVRARIMMTREIYCNKFQVHFQFT